MTARTRRHLWRLVALLLAFGLVAAACSGSDDTENTGADNGGTAAANAGEGVDPDEGSTPVRGGDLVYAREAETSSPWTPAAMICDTSCHQAIRGIYDTLTFVGQDLRERLLDRLFIVDDEDAAFLHAAGSSMMNRAPRGRLSSTRMEPL